MAHPDGRARTRAARRGRPSAGPRNGRAPSILRDRLDEGYHSATEVRFVEGSYLEAGPARAWMRTKVPLVEGEEPTPLERLLLAADSGNGVSAPLDYRRFTFINADLSVAVRRLPDGEWVGLDSVTHVEADGIGLSDTALHDEQGEVGRATQSLLVAPR